MTLHQLRGRYERALVDGKHQRMARYAEQDALFNLAAEYHTRALNYLMSDEFENEFDISIHRQLVESCKTISGYPPFVQVEVPRGLTHIYAASNGRSPAGRTGCPHRR